MSRTFESVYAHDFSRLPMNEQGDKVIFEIKDEDGSVQRRRIAVRATRCIKRKNPNPIASVQRTHWIICWDDEKEQALERHQMERRQARQEACVKRRAAFLEMCNKHQINPDRIPTKKRKALKEIPMLPAAMDAMTYDTNKAQCRWPMLAQPKMDGCRIRITCSNKGGVHILSQNNNPKVGWHTLEDVALELTTQLGEGWVIEGEFYSNSQPPLTWQKLNGAFHKKTDPFVEPELSSLCVYAFDLFRTTGNNEPYHRRLKALKDLLDSRRPSNAYNRFLQLVPYSKRINNEIEADAYYKQMLDNGYEGVVYRNPLATYEPKRTANMLKRKPLFDEEFVIQSFTRTSYGIHVACKDKNINIDSKPIGARWDLTEAKAKEYMDSASTYVGKLVTVTFAGKTEQGYLRTPLVKGVRMDIEENLPTDVPSGDDDDDSQDESENELL